MFTDQQVLISASDETALKLILACGQSAEKIVMLSNLLGAST